MTGGPEASSTIDDPLFIGRRVALRAVRLDDELAIQELENHPRNLRRWRNGGRVVPPGSPSSSAGVFVRLLAIDLESQKMAALLVAYDPDIANGHCSFAILAAPSYHQSSVPGEGLALFLNYLFSTWPLRKVYAEVAEYNFSQFETIADSLFTIEGRLEEHLYMEGRYWDKLILSMTRPQFDRSWMRLSPLSLAFGPSSSRNVGRAEVRLRIGDVLGLSLDEDIEVQEAQVLELDSLGWLELEVALEDAHLRIPPLDVLMEMRTVGDLVAYLDSALSDVADDT